MDGLTTLQLVQAIADLGGMGILVVVLVWFVRRSATEVKDERNRNNELTNGLMESYKANTEASTKMANALDGLADTNKELCTNFQAHRRKTEDK